MDENVGLGKGATVECYIIHSWIVFYYSKDKVILV